MTLIKKGFVSLLILLASVYATAQKTVDNSSDSENTVVFDNFESGRWKGSATRSTQAKEGKYAMSCGRMRNGKPWNVSKDLKRFDASGYKALSFWLYNEKDLKKKIYITISSIPDQEYEKAALAQRFESANYFLIAIDLNFTGWKKIIIPFNRFAKIRNPKGWNAIDNILISMDTREPARSKSTEIIIDDMRLIKRTKSTVAKAKNILTPNDARKLVFGWVMRSFLLDYDYSGLRDRPVWQSTGDQIKDMSLMIKAAKEGGLDGFAIQSNPRKVYYEPTLSVWQNWLTAANKFDFKILFELEMYYSSKQEVIDWIVMTYRKFGNNPSLYRINGKPVYLLWLRSSKVKIPFDHKTGIGGFPPDDWKDIVDTVRRETNNGVFLFADMFDASKVGGCGYSDYEKEELMPLWDGLWEFGGLHNLIMISDKKWDVVHNAMAKYKSDADAAGMTYIAGLIPGFWREEAGWFVDPKGTEYYRKAWDKMIRMNPFGVMIQSWNDYSEDAQISPSQRSKYCLLDLTRYYVDKYKGLPVKKYSSPRIWVSQSAEIMRGGVVYTEFLNLPTTEALLLEGCWVDETGKKLASFKYHLDPDKLTAVKPELPYSLYKNSRSVRIIASLKGKNVDKTATTPWIWLNPVARFDRFTVRYLFDNLSCPDKPVLQGTPPEFSASVSGKGSAVATLMRRNAANKGETPTRMEMPLAIPASHSGPEYDLMIRYFQCEHPDYACSLSMKEGTVKNVKAIGSRIANIQTEGSLAKWTSKTFGRGGMGVNAAFDGIRCTINPEDSNLSLRIGPFSTNINTKELGRDGFAAFPLGKDGFVLVEQLPGRSTSEKISLPFKEKFQLSGLITKPSDAFWLDVQDAKGQLSQSFPVFPHISGKSVTTFFFDEKEKAIKPGTIDAGEALLGSWNFGVETGGLVPDQSPYGNFGKMGGISMSSFGAGVGKAGQSPSRGKINGTPALVFDGTKNQFVAFPSGVLPQGCFTVIFTMDSRKQALSQNILSLGYQASIKYTSNGRLLVMAGRNTLKSDKPLPMPCKIRIVYDMRSIEMYVNNKLSARCDVSTLLPRLTGPVVLGCAPGPNPESYTGAIAGLQIYAAPVRP